MIVHITAVPPTTEATTIKTVVTAFCIWAFFAGTPVAVEDAADTSLVSVTMFGLEPFLAEVVINGATTVGGGGGVEVVNGAAVVVGRGGTDEEIDVTANGCEVVGAATTELTMLFTTGIDEIIGGGAEEDTTGGGAADETTGSLDLGGALTGGADGLAAAEEGAGAVLSAGWLTGAAMGLTTAKFSGPRFLTKRLRVSCSRRTGTASYALASEEVTRARAIVRVKTSVRESPLDLEKNIAITVDRGTNAL